MEQTRIQSHSSIYNDLPNCKKKKKKKITCISYMDFLSSAICLL